jgi:hypothetical protein
MIYSSAQKPPWKLGHIDTSVSVPNEPLTWSISDKLAIEIWITAPVVRRTPKSESSSRFNEPCSHLAWACIQGLMLPIPFRLLLSRAFWVGDQCCNTTQCIITCHESHSGTLARKCVFTYYYRLDSSIQARIVSAAQGCCSVHTGKLGGGSRGFRHNSRSAAFSWCRFN